MRAVPPALAAALASGAVRLARCWRLVRADGMELCATEHDRPLVVDGRTYQPAAALTAGERDSGGGSPSRTGLDGVLRTGLDLPGIDGTDLLLGRWDRARVTALVTDWSDPALFVVLWTARIGRVVQRGHAFELELEGPEAALDVPVTRVFQRGCDATLGDARCGVDLEAPARRFATSVLAQPDPAGVVVAATTLPLPGLAHGTLRFTGGVLAGTGWPLAGVRLVPQGLLLELVRPLPVPPAPADAVELVDGCDRTFTTCRTRFGNAVRFRGCPLMPGDDAVLAGPAASGNDGGRR